MQKPAPTALPILEVIRRRWSSRNFQSRRVPLERIRVLIEAARWAPSANNLQPWRFLICHEDDPASLQKARSCLTPINHWAERAPCLILTFAQMSEDPGKPANRYAWHDTGLATGFLILQATSLGLIAHPMAGFQRDRVKSLFDVPDPYQPVTAVAVGFMEALEKAPASIRHRELAPRTRKPLGDIAFLGSWGKPFADSQT